MANPALFSPHQPAIHPAKQTEENAFASLKQAHRPTISSRRSFALLLKKDLQREFRTKEMLGSMGIYAVLILVVFGASLALVGNALDILSVGGGLLWTQIVFTSLLGLNRSFAYEKENACLEGLLLVPMDRGSLFLSKALSNTLFLSAVEIITVPLFFFFFLSSATLPSTVPFIVAPLFLGTIGIALVGTMLSTITVNTRGKDIMLATLFVPLAFPLLYACASATTVLLAGTPAWFDVFLPAMAIAGAYDIIMALASWALYDFVVSA